MVPTPCTVAFRLPSQKSSKPVKPGVWVAHFRPLDEGASQVTANSSDGCRRALVCSRASQIYASCTMGGGLIDVVDASYALTMTVAKAGGTCSIGVVTGGLRSQLSRKGSDISIVFDAVLYHVMQ